MISEKPIGKKGWLKGTWVGDNQHNVDYGISRLHGQNKEKLDMGIRYGFNGLPFSEELDFDDFFRKGYEIGIRQKEARERKEINKAGELWFLDGQKLEDSDLANNSDFKSGYSNARFNAQIEEIKNKRGR